MLIIKVPELVMVLVHAGHTHCDKTNRVLAVPFRAVDLSTGHRLRLYFTVCCNPPAPTTMPAKHRKFRHDRFLSHLP